MKYKGLRKRLEKLGVIEDHRYRLFRMPDRSLVRLTVEETHQAFSDALAGKRTYASVVVLNAVDSPSFGSDRILQLLHACLRRDPCPISTR
jgi:hypothetical protein